MKHIAITFDDGRSDNYLLAKPVMDKYHLTGTVYITTGFIDGTWEGKDILKSLTRPLNIDEIVALDQAGWEIGLHGDKHQTQVEDMRTALHKLQSWGIENVQWGISVPNSAADENEVTQLLKSEYGNKITYIRRGRKCDTTKLSNRILYGMYSLLGINWAYRCFNEQNVFMHKRGNFANIPSIVIKSGDKPKMIIDFIKHIPDESIVVLMLHSILAETHPLCGKDPWSWGVKKFDTFCAKLKDLIDLGTVEVAPLINIMKNV